jgi:hypothetical protein
MMMSAAGIILAFNNRVNILESQLIRDIGRQFFKRERSPFLASKTIQVDNHEDGKMEVRASLYT